VTCQTPDQLHLRSSLPVGPRAPAQRWKQRGRRGGGLGNLSLHLFFVIFISLILTCPHLPLSLTFPSLFFMFCPFARITMSAVHPGLPTALLSRLTLLLFPQTDTFSSPPSELCLLAISFFPSAPSSASSATEWASIRYMSPGCAPSPRRLPLLQGGRDKFELKA